MLAKSKHFEAQFPSHHDSISHYAPLFFAIYMQIFQTGHKDKNTEEKIDISTNTLFPQWPVKSHKGVQFSDPATVYYTLIGVNESVLPLVLILQFLFIMVKPQTPAYQDMKTTLFLTVKGIVKLKLSWLNLFCALRRQFISDSMIKTRSCVVQDVKAATA